MAKSKLTPNRQKTIVRLIEQGNYASVAVAAAGISAVTYYDWLKRGRSGEQPYANFLNAIKKAESKAEAALVAGIKDAGIKQWQAMAWLLERTRPQRYSRQDRQPIPWQTEIAELLKKGLVTVGDIEQSLGDELAREFFKSSSTVVVRSSEAARKGKTKE